VKDLSNRRLRVMHDADVVFLQQAPHHARAHLTQTDHSELHGFSGDWSPLGIGCAAP
jgi:hypothetical protein